MVTITLQFTSIIIDGQKVYKPSSKMSQLFCITKNVNQFDEEGLRHLQESGYQIIIEEDEILEHKIAVEN